MAIAVVLIVGAVIGVQRRFRERAATAPQYEQAPAAQPEAAEAPELVASEVCPGAGYLCASLDRRGGLLIRRWREGKERLVVRVPEIPRTQPGSELHRQAGTFRAAAIRGILAWDGHPLPIVIDDAGPWEPDFEVRWTGFLSGANMSVVTQRWTKETGIRVDYLEIPWQSHRGGLRTAREVQAAAVKEMGHVLGLEWSDSERDVMHPDNTSTLLSSRDLETVTALYSLPSGTWIRP